MAPAPYRAPCLRVLLAEINARWPGRDKTSDGWLGDAAHAARVSDHNPDPDGSVDAIDVDNDGIDVSALLRAVVGDPRISYVIFNRRWAGVASGWTWRTYTGTNPHDKHVHVSCLDARQNDTRPWGLLASTVSNPIAGPGGSLPSPSTTAPTPIQEDDMSWDQAIPNGDRNPDGSEVTAPAWTVLRDARVIAGQAKAAADGVPQAVWSKGINGGASAEARLVAIQTLAGYASADAAKAAAGSGSPLDVTALAAALRDGLGEDLARELAKRLAG